MHHDRPWHVHCFAKGMGTMLPASHRELIERQHDEAQRKLQKRPSRGRAVEAILPTLAAASIGGAALAIAAQHTRSHGRRDARARRRTTAGLSVLGITAGLGLARWQLARLFTPQPTYDLERRVRALEVRRYPACVEVTTLVDAESWRAGLDEGFSRLAKYIFGENDAKERIAMTAPVLAESAIDLRRARAVRVSFVLPRGRPMQSFPRPLDSRVRVGVRARRRLAAISFGGRFDAERIELKEEELLARAHELGLATRGRPMFAGYDAPSTLPFLRRNEVWVELV